MNREKPQSCKGGEREYFLGHQAEADGVDIGGKGRI